MPTNNPLGMILVIIITVLIPPLGVFAVSGCSVDLIINIALTALGYIPGHVHAFYIEYVYYHRRESAGISDPAPGVFSDRVQRGSDNYGTIA